MSNVIDGEFKVVEETPPPNPNAKHYGMELDPGTYKVVLMHPAEPKPDFSKFV